jgi:hypothetical protein
MEERPMAEDSRKFWNPFTETLSRENIRSIQLKNLRKLVKYSQTNSILYQDRLKDINPEDIRTIEDVKQIPLLDKEDLRLAQEDRSFCGITVLHLPTGARVGEMRYLRSCEEIYDVQIAPGLQRPGILGVEDSTHRRALTLPDQTFWGQGDGDTPHKGRSR